MPINVVYGGLLQTGSQGQLPATSIGGAIPDDTGNVDISSAGVDISEIYPVGGADPIGLLFKKAEEVCSQEDPRRLITHGRCEEGINVPGGLPLDFVAEEYNPEYARENCGCDSSSASSESSESSESS